MCVISSITREALSIIILDVEFMRHVKHFYICFQEREPTKNKNRKNDYLQKHNYSWLNKREIISKKKREINRMEEKVSSSVAFAVDPPAVFSDLSVVPS